MVKLQACLESFGPATTLKSQQPFVRQYEGLVAYTTVLTLCGSSNATPTAGRFSSLHYLYPFLKMLSVVMRGVATCIAGVVQSPTELVDRYCSDMQPTGEQQLVLAAMWNLDGLVAAHLAALPPVSGRLAAQLLLSTVHNNCFKAFQSILAALKRGEEAACIQPAVVGEALAQV